MAGCCPCLRGPVLVGVAPLRAGSGSGWDRGLRSGPAPDRRCATRVAATPSRPVLGRCQASPRLTACRFMPTGQPGGHRGQHPGKLPAARCPDAQRYRANVVFVITREAQLNSWCGKARKCDPVLSHSRGKWWRKRSGSASNAATGQHSVRSPSDRRRAEAQLLDRHFPCRCCGSGQGQPFHIPALVPHHWSVRPPISSKLLPAHGLVCQAI